MEQETFPALSTKERILGAFIGLYFGSGVNPRFSPMLTAEQARKRFGNRKFAEYGGYETYGPFYKLYDQHTMTKIVYEMLLRYGGITPEIFRDYLLELHKRDDVFKGDVYGPSTQKAVKKILAGENVYQMGKTGITCGSAMRALPIGMYFHDDPAALIRNTIGSCIISHNTDVAIDAAIACNVTLSNLINGRSKFDAILEGIRAAKENHGKFGEKTDEPAVYEKLEEALQALKGKGIGEAMYYIPEKIGVGWFARETIPGAFANYIVSNTPQDSSLLSMRCGRDNQTVPEIACSFLGAEKGPAIFPEKVIREIEEVNNINIGKMTDQLLKRMNSQKNTNPTKIFKKSPLN